MPLFWGRAESLPHLGFQGGFGPLFTAVEEAYPGNLPPHNWFTEDERKSRRKPWRFYGAWAVTSRPQCGRFQGLELALFRLTRFEIGAVFSQKPPESPL